jgi:uncharacterized membrane protein YphA (DoxX/SURF4 family)
LPARLGLLSIIFIVALRFMIGFHFYREGASKIQNPNWTSRAFMSAAVGPFADSFHAMVPDKDLLVPTEEEKMLIVAGNKDDKAEVRTLQTWRDFREQIKSYYALDKPGKKKADAIYKHHVDQLGWVLYVYEDDLVNYEAGTSLAEKMKADPNFQDVDSRAGQVSYVEKKANDKGAGVIKDIESIWASYEKEMNDWRGEGFATATTSAPAPDKPAKDSAFNKDGMRKDSDGKYSDPKNARFTLTSKKPGGKYDGVKILFVADKDISKGQETGKLDLDKKTLTFTFAPEQSTIAHIRNVIQKDPRNDKGDEVGLGELFEVSLPGNGRGYVTAEDTAVFGGGAELATANKPPLKLNRPYSEVEADLAYVDSWIPYMHVTLGICLMIGFLTRFWSVIGALFLMSVVASQLPFDFYTWSYVEPVLPPFNQCVEMLALLFLAAVGAGKFAGVDFLLWSGYRYFVSPKPATSTAATATA